MKQPLNWKQIIFGLIIGISTIIFIAHCDSTPPKSDKELYFTFYNDIVARMNDFDNKIKPFQNAVAVKEHLEAINIASSIEDDVTQLWSKLQGVSVPDLQNKTAQKELDQAKEYLSDAYFNKSQALKAFVEYSKKPSPYLMAKITKDSNQTQTLMLGGSAKLIAAGGELGLSIDQIKKGSL